MQRGASKAFETERNLRAMGLSIENIAAATGLTAQDMHTLYKL